MFWVCSWHEMLMAALFIPDEAYLQEPLRRPGGNELPKGKAFEKNWRKLQWKPGRVSAEGLFKPGSCQIGGLPRWLRGKESACNAGDLGSVPGCSPWIGKIPWRRKWQSTPAFLPRESQGPRSLVGYSPWRHKESALAKRLSRFTFFHLAKCL